VLMFDDMISTAGTICEAAKLVREHGAKDIIAAATHAVLVGPAVERLGTSPISRVVVTNTIPLAPRVEPLMSKLVQLDVGSLLGEALLRIHNNQSVSALFKDTAGVKR
jgi:ribose-phosphate pyrophosphokinase